MDKISTEGETVETIAHQEPMHSFVSSFVSILAERVETESAGSLPWKTQPSFIGAVDPEASTV